MLWQRILTVFLAAPFLIGVILCPLAAVFKAVVVLFLTLGLWEFFSITGASRREKFFATALGLLHILYLLFVPLAWRDNLLEGALLLFLSFAYYIATTFERDEDRPPAGVASRIGLMVLGILYVGTLGSFMGFLRDLPEGVFWVFLLLGMTWLNDTAAYFFGRRFGRHRLAPRISPGKTAEGFLGGFLGNGVAFLFFWWLFGEPIPLERGLLLAGVTGLVGPLGDLAESLLKRGFGVKDSGTLIPGHGGVLDRIDALLFTAPVVYFFGRL